jgi:hypothetical protein
MSKTDVDTLINGKEDEAEELDDMFEDDDIDMGDVVEDDDDMGVDTEKKVSDDLPDSVSDGWARVMANVPDPLAKAKENSQYENVPTLIVEFGPTYYLSIDLTDEPHTREFEGKYGTYESTAMKVFLEKVSDDELYDLIFDKGDYAGELRYINGKKYTLWLDEKAMGFFKLFWMKHRGVPVPDDRTFTYRKSKSGKYNNHTFKLPK